MESPKIKSSISKELILKISKEKNEPEWILKKRLEALKLFNQTPMPQWGPKLNELNLNTINYYTPAIKEESKNWKQMPQNIKKTFIGLGIKKAEQKILGGVGLQYDSSSVYHNLKSELEKKGVIFESMDIAVQKHPKLIKKYFMTDCIKINEHKFSMLHAAVWSGGTFIYVPENVKVEIPMQAYFRMSAQRGGQFEHTLIIAGKNSQIHYIEGCSSPRQSENSLHAGGVEIFVMEGAKVKYSSIENWSKNVYNLNTKKAIVEKNGLIEWVNGNMGSKITMLYPCSVLEGDNSKSQCLGIAFAGIGQNQDTGMKIIHKGKNTSSILKSKSISKDGGITTYRGLVKIEKSATNAISNIECDSLLIGKISSSNSYPIIDVKRKDAQVNHEAKIGKIGEKEIFYLTSRGINEDNAKKMIVNGFFSPISQKLPLDYAVEFNKIIDIEMKKQ